MQISWQMIFDGWAPVIRTLVIGGLGYIYLVAILRWGGKRTLSKMNAFDFVVTVAFGSTLASMLTSNNVSLVQGMCALGLLVGLQFVCTFLAVRSNRFQKWIKAQPTLLLFRGEFLTQAMKQQRVTQEEIIAAMRQQSISDPQEVDAVVLETEGSLAVLRKGAATTEALDKLGVHVSGEVGSREAAPSPKK